MFLEYEKLTKAFALDKAVFSLVECLESVTSYWGYKNPYSIPSHNVYIPTAKTITPRPKLDDDSLNLMGINRISSITPPSSLRRTSLSNIQ